MSLADRVLEVSGLTQDQIAPTIRRRVLARIGGRAITHASIAVVCRDEMRCFYDEVVRAYLARN